MMMAEGFKARLVHACVDAHVSMTHPLVGTQFSTWISGQMLLNPLELEEAADSHRLFKPLRCQLVERGIQGLNENILVGFAWHKPGHIGDQPPLTLGVEPNRQGDGVLRPMEDIGRRRDRR